MIHSIDSDHEKFKKIKFQNGFNIILADRTEKASIKDSRNGLGKSTMINIVNFCLGGEPKDALNNSKLNDSTFTLEIDLDGKRFKISRSPGNKTQIFVDGDYSDWPIQPKPDLDTGKWFLKKDSLRDVLGKLMFDLSPGLPEFHPSFGSLISYFIRKPGGFLDSFKQSSQQLTWDIQTNNAYLLNLGWKFATDLQILKKQKNDLDAFKREISLGGFVELIGNAGKLAAEKIKLEIKMEQQKSELDKFQINTQYEQIEKKANHITETIHDSVNQNVMEQLLLNRYNDSLDEGEITDVKIISGIYQEVGIHFSEKLTKTLEEVNNFHSTIIKNRKDFLNSEILKLGEGILNRTKTIDELDKNRSELMEILNTQGALKEYTKIQKNYGDSQSELNQIKSKLENLKIVQDKDNQIKIDKQQLYQSASRDMTERIDQTSSAIKIFGKFSSTLYNEFGKLLINLNMNGFEFGIDIPRSSSQGIGNMKVFCYDLTLAKIWSLKKQSPGFLIHDSMIFDGVDERQRAGALQLAKESSNEIGFQYICTLNSDMIPHNDLKENFDLQKYVIRTLTDLTPDGGILGIRI